MDIRSFIALPLSEEMAASFFEVAETLCNIEHFQQIRWLPPQNCHMTLAFLGNVEEERLGAWHVSWANALLKKLWKSSVSMKFPLSLSMHARGSLRLWQKLPNG